MAERVLIIIPAYNEEKTIEKTVESVIKSGYDYIVINDGSTDSTEEILEKNNYNHISLIFNLGIGGAVQTGYKYARDNNYDIAIQVDADGQHDISFIKDLIKPIKDKEANLVIGSNFVDKNNRHQRSSKIRRLGIKFLSNTVLILSHKRVYDITSGFRAADKKVIERFADNYPTEYPEPVSNFDLLRTSNITIKEVPVIMNKRQGGKSSITPRKTTYAAFNVLLSILILSLRRKHD